jgi:hypothetical protein
MFWYCRNLFLERINVCSKLLDFQNAYPMKRKRKKEKRKKKKKKEKRKKKKEKT